MLLAADYKDRFSSWLNEEVQDYGFREWCNMQGRYVTFVAHGIPSLKISICNVAVFGTIYSRNVSPETIVEIPAN